MQKVYELTALPAFVLFGYGWLSITNSNDLPCELTGTWRETAHSLIGTHSLSDSLNEPIRGQAPQEVKSILLALTFSVPEIAASTGGEKDTMDPALGAHSPA